LRRFVVVGGGGGFGGLQEVVVELHGQNVYGGRRRAPGEEKEHRSMEYIE
jgi:hypothetical protein